MVALNLGYPDARASLWKFKAQTTPGNMAIAVFHRMGPAIPVFMCLLDAVGAFRSAQRSIKPMLAKLKPGIAPGLTIQYNTIQYLLDHRTLGTGWSYRISPVVS
jgi:hypothetical protein